MYSVSVLSHAELDARKSSGEYVVAANPLTSLAEIYNHYNRFQPQNLMVKYIIPTPGAHPVKTFPFSASSPDCFQQAMVCSIALLDQSDFEFIVIICQMVQGLMLPSMMEQ